MESVKPDYASALQRKTRQSSAAGLSRTLSPVRFQEENRRIAPIFSDFRGMQPGFSATQTAWRRAQSHANFSPQDFPANRENYREFASSKAISALILAASSSYSWVYRDLLANRNRERTGNYQGESGIMCGEQGIAEIKKAGVGTRAGFVARSNLAAGHGSILQMLDRKAVVP